MALPAPSRHRPVCATPDGANRSARLASTGIQFLPGAAEHEREVFHHLKWLVCALQTVRRPGLGIYSRLKAWPCHVLAGLGTRGLPNGSGWIRHLAAPTSSVPAWHHHDGHRHPSWQGDPREKLQLHPGSWSLGGDVAPHGPGLGVCATPSTHRELLALALWIGLGDAFWEPTSLGLNIPSFWQNDSESSSYAEL